MNSVAVCIGSLTDREPFLERCADAWRLQEGVAPFVGVLKDRPLGASWNTLGHSAFMAQWLLFVADDQQPWPDALAAGVGYLQQHPSHVAALRLYQDGRPLDASYDAKAHGERTPWARGWLLHPGVFEQVGDFLELSWYLDIDYSQRLSEAGFPIVAVDGFGADHLDAPRDWLTPEVRERQYRAYLQACADGNRSPFV